jgi:uncharacterized LabA/DUF88 family protein
MPLLLFWGEDMRTYVYVDGFNLYYAIRNTRYKWLNLRLLAKNVLPADLSILKVKYYTARVSGAGAPDKPRKQQLYLNALKTVPEVETYFGNFLAKNVWRPVTNLPVSQREIGMMPVVTPNTASYFVLPDATDSRSRQEVLSTGSYRIVSKRGQKPKIVSPVPKAIMAQVYWMEEKGSDVNLACHLVSDAWEDLFDVAAVISNDTDLVEPIRIVTQKRGKKVILVSPGPWNSAQKLVEVASSVRHINPSILKDSQFPATIPGTEIRRPDSWA